MTERRRRLGEQGESLVAARLSGAGWRIVERNARTRYGELDIVALDASTLVFVEVKAVREGSRFGPERPVLYVDFRKQRRVRRLATAWMTTRRDLPAYEEIRFDAVGVILGRDGRAVEVEHIEAAF